MLIAIVILNYIIFFTIGNLSIGIYIIIYKYIMNYK